MTDDEDAELDATTAALTELARSDATTAGVLAVFRLASADGVEKADLEALGGALSPEDRAEADAYAALRTELARLDAQIALRARRTNELAPTQDGEASEGAHATARNLIFAATGLVVLAALAGVARAHAAAAIAAGLAAVLFLLGLGLRLSAGSAPPSNSAAPWSARERVEQNLAESRRARVALLVSPEARRVKALVRAHPKLRFDALGE